MTSGSSDFDIDCLIIGAGVIGLAIARALAMNGRDVLVAEALGGIGQGVSSRNSEVIHAGIYYPPGSLKAQMCVTGKHMLYDFCASHNVPHARCGKIIVATRDDQRKSLETIRQRAGANGVADLEYIDRAEIARMEPQVEAVAGLHSPSTGIVDSHALMLALLGDIEHHGGALALNTPMLSARKAGDGLAVSFGGPDPCEIAARNVVLAAGLAAPFLSRTIAGIDPQGIPQAWFAKGTYFSLGRAAPFSRLVYPVPEPGGLGVHLTLDIAGRARFGPDVEWLEASRPEDIDYAPDPARAERFYAAIRRYWPGLRDGELQPDYTGVRPKIAGPGMADADFTIHGPRKHGVAGLTALYGIESPGLTSALAIAARIAEDITAPHNQQDRIHE